MFVVMVVNHFGEVYSGCTFRNKEINCQRDLTNNITDEQLQMADRFGIDEFGDVSISQLKANLNLTLINDKARLFIIDSIINFEDSTFLEKFGFVVISKSELTNC